MTTPQSLSYSALWEIRSPFAPPTPRNPSWGCFSFKIPSGLEEGVGEGVCVRMRVCVRGGSQRGTPCLGRHSWETRSSQSLVLGVGGPPWVPGLVGAEEETGREGDPLEVWDPQCPQPPLPPSPPAHAGPNSPPPASPLPAREPRGERGAETDGEVGVVAMQLLCVQGTGQS